MVRTAVLKGKDPMKLLEEMELIDRMGNYFKNCLCLLNHAQIISFKSVIKTADLSTCWWFPFTEYNPMQPPSLNEKVLREKRKKLRETFDRVFKLYVSLHNFMWQFRLNLNTLAVFFIFLSLINLWLF